jgi:hypothetical protein
MSKCIIEKWWLLLSVIILSLSLFSLKAETCLSETFQMFQAHFLSLVFFNPPIHTAFFGYCACGRHLPLLYPPHILDRGRGRGREITCKWLLTWANVRSLTSMSSRTDFGVAPINNEPIQEKRKKKVLKSKQNIEKSLKFKVFVQNSKTNHSHTNYCSSKKMKKEK